MPCPPLAAHCSPGDRLGFPCLVEVLVHDSGMDRSPQSSRSPGAAPGPLRTRAPLGLVSASSAAARVAALVGSRISAVEESFGRAVLVLEARPLHLLVVAAPVSICAAGRADEVLVDPAGARAQARLRELVGHSVTGMTVEGSGALHVSLGADQLRIPSDPGYEAWELRGMDGGLLACLPGGGLSLWTPTFGVVASAR